MVLRVKKYYFLLFVLLLAGFGCETIPPAGERPHEPDIALNDLCVRYGLRCDLDGDSQVITIESAGERAKTMVGSDIVMLEKERINIGGLVRLEDGVIYVPYDFKVKIIMPMAEKFYSKKKTFIIMIDAGHGGHDPGGIGSLGTKEKNIVLDIAKRLRANLEARGISCLMTRNSDDFISLERRAELANEKRVNLFVSIHANISKSRKVKGIEVFCLKELDSVERKEAMSSVKHESLFSKFKMKQNDARLKKTLLLMMSAQKKNEESRLSGHLSRELTGALDAHNRGDKKAGFYVLKYTLVPSVLIEVGFLSNKIEEQNLRSSEYRQKIADSIADSLVRYFKDHLR